MLIRVCGATLHGVDGLPVIVEVDAGSGLPGFHIVGQADRVVNESRDRIRAAFRQCGLTFPEGRVTVNLVPTALPKAGSGLDLGIALAIVATKTELPPRELARYLLVGELGLDGALHPVRGALALMQAARIARLAEAIVPVGNLAEAAMHPEITALGATDLSQVIAYLRGETQLRTQPPQPAGGAGGRLELDLADVRGQEGARRALELTAAGGHNLLMQGPPGSGKTLLARRLPGILPALSRDQALQVTRIHSVAGTLGDRPLVEHPPFRAPHHTTSEIGMTGGGRPLRPGEISLAHCGILFLDEFPEFRRPVLEALRQPLEEGRVRIVRAHGALDIPARFQLVAAMNPCPCGYRGDPNRECRCDEALVRRYRARLSGPLLDRIDIHVAVPPVPWREMLPASDKAETSVRVAERVSQARDRQRRRLAGTGFRSNSDLPDHEIRRSCSVDAAGLEILGKAVERLGLSMRACTRILRVARTAADLDGADRISVPHLAEAIGYRETETRD
jgi:magnesium chelatase family protein